MKNLNYKIVFDSFTNAQKIAFSLLFAICIVIGVLMPVILPSSSLRQIELSRSYRAGELSDEDVYAPDAVNFIDEVATENDRQEARKSVLPYYSFNSLDTIERLIMSQNYLDAIKAEDSNDAYKILRDHDIFDSDSVTYDLINLSDEERNLVCDIVDEVLINVLRNGIFSSSDIKESIDEGYRNITVEHLGTNYKIETQEINAESALTLENVYEKVLDYALEKYSSVNDKVLITIAKAVKMLSIENIRYDALKTESFREEASNATSPVAIRLEEGDLIIARDTIITEQQLRIVDQINNRRIEIPPSALVSYALFLITVMFFSYYFFVVSIQYKYRIPLYSLIFLVGILVELILSFLMISFILSREERVLIDPLLPFLFLPLLFTCITNKRRVGFSVGFVTAAFAVLFPTSNKFTFFLLLVVIEASVFFVHRGTNRLDVIYEALYSSLIAAIATAIFSLLSGFSYSILARNIVFIILNVLLTYIAVSIALPILEKVFNLPTQFRLHELSYTDTPTLNRLSQVAQGTFNHVRNVSDMSYAAAKEIGADAELTRVGALYHDIGKAEHPEYFIENQGGKGNVHDELNNNLSAAIIKSHVKLGVEKGREIGLPQEVLDIIGQHHGNDIIMYFYNEAKKNSPDAARLVREEDFRYNGEIPQSPESAIVMLADCVEAASRTLKNPNTQKYDRLIMNIIMSKINHGQMAQSKLTLTDIMKIKDTFIRSLVGRDHQRIEYDKE